MIWGKYVVVLEFGPPQFQNGLKREFRPVKVVGLD
jgi:hypothetical protein